VCEEIVGRTVRVCFGGMYHSGFYRIVLDVEYQGIEIRIIGDIP